DLGKATWMRIKKAQINCRRTSSILGMGEEELEKYEIKNNLAFKVIKEARRLNISFRLSEKEESLVIDKNGTELAEILCRERHQSYWKSEKPTAWTVEQLIDHTGKRMLSWAQLRKAQGLSTRGRIPGWYKYLENTMLEEKAERKLKLGLKLEENRGF